MDREDIDENRYSRLPGPWYDGVAGDLALSVLVSRGGVVIGSSFGVSGSARSAASTRDSRYCIRRARAESSAPNTSFAEIEAAGSLQGVMSSACVELVGESELPVEDRAKGEGPWARLRTKLVAKVNASSSADIDSGS